MKYNSFNIDPYGGHVKVINLVGSNKNVLEVGCATGQMSRRLLENGCQVVGLEVDGRSAREAKKYCTDVIVADIETLDALPYRNCFDCILFMDVLEHISYPASILRKLSDYLKDDGIIIATLPNIGNYAVIWQLLLGNFDYTRTGLLDESHIRFFAINSAKRLFEEAGLDIVKMDVTPSGSLHVRHKIAYALARFLPSLFAYQFIFVGRKKQ